MENNTLNSLGIMQINEITTAVNEIIQIFNQLLQVINFLLLQKLLQFQPTNTDDFILLHENTCFSTH